MKKEYQDIISEYLGVEPVEINSSLVSAQNRKRLYWTNIPNITQPEDKNIGLHDVINHGVENYKIPQNWQIRVPNYYPLYVDPYNKSELFNKSNTLRTNVNNGNMWVKVPEGYRNLTREECEKLQTIPVGYTNCVSENKAKRCIGNAWTIDVITHILRNLRT